ncbi:MAG: hypothetical protein AB7V39_25640 [Nitrospiraceae bacterium]
MITVTEFCGNFEIWSLVLIAPPPPSPAPAFLAPPSLAAFPLPESEIVTHGGQAVTTIRGLSRPGDPRLMQAAFVKHDGYVEDMT